MQADGKVFAAFGGYYLDLGTFSPSAAGRLQDLRVGLPLKSLISSRRDIDQQIYQLVRRLARRGLLEYPVRRVRSKEEDVVIEPQAADYWPEAPPLDDEDTMVLSRFALLRRRGNAMVLESPRAGALLRICNPQIAAALARLSAPQQLKRFRRREGFPGIELLAVLLDCQMLFKVERSDKRSLRTAEGDANLVLWDFHDLLFHTRSTEGRHANPLGGLYPYAATTPALPAVRALWSGKKVGLDKLSAAPEAMSPFVKLLNERHSTRSFDDQRPISLADLARFLQATARIRSKSQHQVDLGEAQPSVEYTTRPYPSAGGSYELELYLAVNKCEGLDRGFYHYDADGHVLVAIDTRAPEFDAVLASAQFAMDAAAPPQILLIITARFGRVSWKYSSIAYALVLKDVGVLLQTLYLTAVDMGLGGCAIGTVNIDLFAKMTGLEFHIESPVGQFAMGRPAETEY
ncbi:MAG: SagB family peptide dehydrogenase [Xanthobacteraceae bacterium]|nr:SagB family peptide dehydrogenase [Xanthobacteraceae bacterium]